MQAHERKAYLAIKDDGWEIAGHNNTHQHLVFKHPLYGAIQMASSPKDAEISVRKTARLAKKKKKEHEGYVTRFVNELCDIHGVGEWEAKAIPMNLRSAIQGFISRQDDKHMIHAARLSTSARESTRLQLIEGKRGPGNRDSIWLLYGKYATPDVHEGEKPEPVEPAELLAVEPESAPEPAPEPEPTPEPEPASDPVAQALAPMNGTTVLPPEVLFAALSEYLMPEARRVLSERQTQIELAGEEMMTALATVKSFKDSLSFMLAEVERIESRVQEAMELLRPAVLGSGPTQ